MISKRKIFIVIIAGIMGTLVFVPADFPDNEEFKEALISPSADQVIIVFNSGGWGSTPPAEADDFLPILEGITDALKRLGYKTRIASYERTKNTFWGKVTGLRELIFSFMVQSETLANIITDSIKANPESKIIITGLSNGAAFVDKTMEKISQTQANNVLAIEVGTPFWEKPLKSENVLFIDNEGQDSLSRNQTFHLVVSIFKAPVRVLKARLSGENLSLSRAFQVPGHEYQWDTSAGKEIMSFLEESFIQKN